MKKTLLLLIGVLFTCFSLSSQTRHSYNNNFFKEIFEFKLKFLAQEMELKPDQREKFFELYKKMSEEKRDVFDEVRKLEKSLKEDKKASEEDYLKVNEAIANAKSRDAEIEKKYDEQFAEFLSSKQIFMMKSAEERFREKMKEMRHQKQGAHSSNGAKDKKSGK